MNSLHDVEKWLKRLIAAAFAGSVAWVSGMGCLLQLGLAITIIGIPLAMFFTASPTIFRYMLAGLPIWLLLRPLSGWVAAAASLLVMLGAGIGVAEISNRRLDRMLVALAGQDHGQPLLLPRGSRVALLGTWDARPAPACRDLCQRLLLSGVARMVLVGRPTALANGAPITAWFIAPALGGCRPAALPDVRAEVSDLGVDVPYADRPVLSSRLSAVYGAGYCLTTGRRTIADADVVLVDEDRPDWGTPKPIMGVDWRLAQLMIFSRSRILQRQQGRLVEIVRNTWGMAHVLARPLYLLPPNFDDAGEHVGHWGWSDVRDIGDHTYPAARFYLLNDLSVGGLVGWDRVVYRRGAMAKLIPED